jgi:hypothetical protein
VTTDDAKHRLYDTTFLIGAFRRRSAIKALATGPDSLGVVTLAQALREGHPEYGRIRSALRQLSPLRDDNKIAALWDAWAQAPDPELAKILSALGWPSEYTQDARFVRAVLAAATSAAAPEILHAVAVFARALPVKDEASNDGIYAAWIRCQSVELEKLIDEQARQASSPALEALHALVTGRLERYFELNDADGMLLVHAFNMAPEPFRASIARTVGASPDRGLLENYRRALSSVTADAAGNVENLKLVGDEDGLFEVTRSLRLLEVVDLCERWSGSAGRPGGTQQRAAVERSLAAHRTLGAFKVEDAAPLPEGLVDIFEWWRNEKPSDEQLRCDLEASDPFRRARGLYLGREGALVDDARLRGAAASEHWPERLVARLLEPELFSAAAPDSVFWVNACAGDTALLLAPIDGMPEDYARHTALLGQGRSPIGSRTRAFLEILCAFQGVFVASSIVIDESTETADPGAVEIEDAPHVDF